MKLFDIFNDCLSIEEIKFLKYINNKATDVQFSPRWQFVKGILPHNTIAKLLKYNYICVNSNRYSLTSQGIRILEKNKAMFLSERDKAPSIFHDLTSNEYIQLKVFNKLEKYVQLKNENLSCDKGYSKYNILWSIYNEVILENVTKDLCMCSIAYLRMSEQLYKEKKCEGALKLLIVALYYHLLDFYYYDKSLYERHIYKHHKALSKYIQKCNLKISDINDIFVLFLDSISKYVQHPDNKVVNLLIENYWNDISKELPIN